MVAHIFFWNYSGIMYGGFYGIPFLLLTEIITQMCMKGDMIRSGLILGAVCEK